MGRDTKWCVRCGEYTKRIYAMIFRNEFRRAVDLVRERTAHRKWHLARQRSVPSSRELMAQRLLRRHRPTG